MSKLKLILTLVIVITFISCFSNPFGFDKKDLPLTGVTWELKSLHYSNGSISVEQDAFNILFSDSGTVTSKMDCNDCYGGYSTRRNNVITIDPGACTEVYCGPNSKDQEIYSTIKQVTKYLIDGKKLRLYFGRYYLLFRSQ